MTDGVWAQTWEILHYRIQAVETAEKFARRMGIQAPKASCWDMDDWLRNFHPLLTGENSESESSQKEKLVRLSGRYD